MLFVYSAGLKVWEFDVLIDKLSNLQTIKLSNHLNFTLYYYSGKQKLNVHQHGLRYTPNQLLTTYN
jgi:hypothetical protein